MLHRAISWEDALGEYAPCHETEEMTNPVPRVVESDTLAASATFGTARVGRRDLAGEVKLI